MTHASVGGCTTGAYLIGYMATPNPLTNLARKPARTLKHVLDYSLQGSPCAAPVNQKGKVFYEEVDRLHPLSLLRPVVYPTTFSSTGFCSRVLSSRGLGHAFNFPLVVVSRLLGEPIIHPLWDRLIPLKVVDTVWSSFLVRSATAVTQFDLEYRKVANRLKLRWVPRALHGCQPCDAIFLIHGSTRRLSRRNPSRMIRMAYPPSFGTYELPW